MHNLYPQLSQLIVYFHNKIEGCFASPLFISDQSAAHVLDSCEAYLISSDQSYLSETIDEPPNEFLADGITGLIGTGIIRPIDDFKKAVVDIFDSLVECPINYLSYHAAKVKTVVSPILCRIGPPVSRNQETGGLSVYQLVRLSFSAEFGLVPVDIVKQSLTSFAYIPAGGIKISGIPRIVDIPWIGTEVQKP